MKMIRLFLLLVVVIGFVPYALGQDWILVVDVTSRNYGLPGQLSK